MSILNFIKYLIKPRYKKEYKPFIVKDTKTILREENLKIELFCEETIDYCHNLKNYAGPCSRQHGHTGLLQIWIKGDICFLDKSGILFDFNNIKEIKKELCHYNINKIFDEKFGGASPSAENMALYVYNKLKKNSTKNYLEFKVRFYENAVLKKCYAELGDLKL